MPTNRIIVSLFGVLFAALGAAFWIAPEQGGRYLALDAQGVAGLISLQAEMGGLFIGLSALSLWGAVTGTRAPLHGAVLVLAGWRPGD